MSVRVCSNLTIAKALVACALLVVVAAEPHDKPFNQYESNRFYNRIPPSQRNRAPWPVLPIQPRALCRALPSAAAPATLCMSEDGLMHVVSEDGSTSAVTLKPPLAHAPSMFVVVPDDTITVVTCDPKGCSWFRCGNGSFTCTAGPGDRYERDFGTVLALEVDGCGHEWIATEHAGMLRIASSTATSFGKGVHGNVTALTVASKSCGSSEEKQHVAVATDLAVYFNLNPTTLEFDSHVLVGAGIDASPTAIAFVHPLQSTDATQATQLPDLWIGHTWCLNVLHLDDGTVDRVSGEQGLPIANVTVLEPGFEIGSLWIGSQQGLAFRCPHCDDVWRYFHGDRWLAASSDVVSLASIPDRRGAWVSTSAGLSFIRTRSTTLPEKAAIFTTNTAKLARYRWVAGVGLASYGDQSNSSIIYHDGDNDGLWTGMLVAAKVFEFAATGSEDARQLAWHHFAAVEFLHNVTGTKGFIARTAVRCGDSHGGGDSGICPKGSPHSCGWVNSSECYEGVDNITERGACCWQWKRDTSSDEVTGHFFTLLVAHEHLAKTAMERKRVSGLLCDTADYLLKGGLVFVDPISGKGTSWGYWDPAQLNGVPGKPNERGGNSLSALGYFAAAARICNKGSSDHGQAFADLVRKHHYDLNTINALATSPQSLAFFDFRLAFMSYHTLALAVPELMVGPVSKAAVPPFIPLEKHEAMAFKNRLQTSVRRYFGELGATANGQNNHVAALSIVYRLITGQPGLADPDWQLRRYPTDLTDWPTQNSRRLDVRLSPDWLSCPKEACDSNLVVEKVLPADEALTHGSSDFVTEGGANSVDGGGGFSLNAPNPWLLVYWMGRYYNSLATADVTAGPAFV